MQRNYEFMFLFPAEGGVFLTVKIIKFNFNKFPIPLSGKIVMYICPKCKYKTEVLLKLLQNRKKKIY